jgi:hypothetical protein
MGRAKKLQEDKKVKFGVSIDPDIYKLLNNDKEKRSRIIEKLLRDYYGKKGL